MSVASLVSIPGENERQRAEQERKMEQMRREEMWERKERRQKEQSEEEERRLWMMRQAENKRRAQIMDTFNRVQMEDNAMRDKISMSARRPESHSPEGAPSVIGAASHTRNSNTVSLVSKPASDRDCRFREQMARVYAEREEGLKANEPGPSEILRTVSPFSRSSTPRDNMIREQMAWIYGKDEGVLNVPVQCELPSAEPLETLQLPAVRLASHIEMPTFDTPAEGSGPTAGDLGNTVQPRQSIPELDTGQMRVDLRVEEISLELGTGQIKVELHAEETVVQETDGIKVELAANEILHELHKISHELDSEEVKVEL